MCMLLDTDRMLCYATHMCTCSNIFPTFTWKHVRWHTTSKQSSTAMSFHLCFSSNSYSATALSGTSPFFFHLFTMFLNRNFRFSSAKSNVAASTSSSKKKLWYVCLFSTTRPVIIREFEA